MSKNTADRQQKAPYYAATDPHKLAQRFMKCRGRDQHGHHALRFWREEFWTFQDGLYHRVSSGELQAAITAFIREEFQRDKPTSKNGQLLPVTRNVVGNVMQALKGEVLVREHLDQPLWLGNSSAGPFFIFANGMVDRAELMCPHNSGQRVTPHCSLWFSQTSFPYNYEPAATCPRWLKFLDDVLEGDQQRIALLQQWFGYCLTADTTQQKFVVAVGDGQNGKSVMLDLLTAVLGPENVSHVRAELFAQRFQLTATLGKLANISYDTGEIDESAEATIKEFTGGDRMYFDRKGIPGVSAYPSARLILATNHEPRFADRSKGIWRRMIVIPFRVSIEQDRQDPELASKLKVELPGIFNWAVEGLRELKRNGQFRIPDMCREAWTDLKSESNPAQEFLQENYEAAGPGNAIASSALYQEYCDWCSDRGFKVLDIHRFGKELRKVFPSTQRKREASGQRVWKYHGLTATLGTSVPPPVAHNPSEDGGK
jgi:P4 family phage/plasmid primase-like protien